MHDKHRKRKKEKKSKKKIDKRRSTSSESDDNDMWIEKTDAFAKDPLPNKDPSVSVTSSSATASNVMAHPQESDDWMAAIIPTYTRNDIRAERKKKTEPELPSTIDQPGQHPRELNPYWKDGGVGLPSSEDTATKTGMPGVSGASLSWLESAYSRCIEKAEETGCSVDEVAAERWGSLKKLKKMIADAKAAQKTAESAVAQKTSYHETDHFDEDSYRKNRRKQFARPRSRSKSPEHIKHKSRSPKRTNRSRSRSPRYKKHRSRSRSRSASRDKHRSKSPHSYHKRDSDSYSKSRHGEIDYLSDVRKNRRVFQKPTDDDDYVMKSRTRYNDVRSSDGWRKKGFVKPDESGSNDIEPDVRRNFTQRKRSVEKDSDGSSTSSESENESTPEKLVQTTTTIIDTPQPLTDAQMNQLGAKILRAEMMNDLELVAKLKSQLSAAQKLKQDGVLPDSNTTKSTPDTVLLTRTGRGGMVTPLELEGGGEGRREGRRRKRKIATHDKEGQRERYFGDDDKGDLNHLVQQERIGTAQEETEMFVRLASKVKMRQGDDTVDDLMIDKAATSGRQQSHIDSSNKLKAIMEHKKLSGVMDKCRFCFDKTAKHLIVAVGKKVYLSVPSYAPLTPGHCLIIPMHHSPSCTALDEDVFDEIQTFRQSLTRMFTARDEDCVFMEMSRSLKHLPHTKVECVPLARELGDVAPIYFKKALMECESEWSQNKKLVDLKNKDVRRAIPKGFPYFAVDFGLQGGYAHVIEDDRLFPEYFGREIVGGMVDAEPTLWRKPRDQSFKEQSQRVFEFTDWWKAFDCTLDT